MLVQQQSIPTQQRYMPMQYIPMQYMPMHQQYMAQSYMMPPQYVQPIMVPHPMMMQQPVMVRHVMQQPVTMQRVVQRVVPFHEYYSESDKPRLRQIAAAQRRANRPPPSSARPSMGTSTAVRVAGGYKVFTNEGGEANTELHIGRFANPHHEDDDMSSVAEPRRGSKSSYYESSSSSKRQLGRSSSSSTYDLNGRAYLVPPRTSSYLEAMHGRPRSAMPLSRDASTHEFASRSSLQPSCGSLSGSRSTSALHDSVRVSASPGFHGEHFDRMSTEALAGLISSAARSLAQRP